MSTAPPGFDYGSLKAMTSAQRSARVDSIAAELDRLGGHDKPTRSQEERTDSLTFELRAIQRVSELERIKAAAEDPDNGFPEQSSTFGRNGGRDQLEERARRVVDAAHKAGTLTDDSAARAETMVTAGSPGERSIVQEWMSVTGTPEYFSAFVKLANDPTRGHVMWTEAERAAFTAGGRIQSLLSGKVNPYTGEARAMSLTDANGGYLVPFQLDPTVILTNSGVETSIHELAREVVATGDVWNGVSSAGVSGSWDAEATEVSDDSPTLAQPSIPIHMARIFVPISIEAFEDAANVATEVGRLIADEARTMEAVAFTTGSGGSQPTGIITALAGGSSAVAPITPETFAAGDVFAVQNALPARHQANATWQANLSLINTLRQFETTNGALKFPEVVDGRLLGRALHENSAMDGTIDAAATETNYPLLYGDMQNFVVARRIGLTVELIPLLFHTSNNRPSGQRGWFAHFRVGSDSVNDAAFRMLSIPTTA
jgi:HK97 family phage major capsid protein